MRIGILTAGGDCPGLNAVIRSVVHRAVVGHGDEVIGFEDGFKGLLDGHFRPLDLNAVSGILARGGTILGSARLERDRLREAAENCAELSLRYGIDALIPIGGEGTLTAARMLSDAGMPVVGVPKTIDNDISATDRTFGFDTAVGVATEAIDRLKTTAESHQRVMVVEVMGRHAGWIALESGMAKRCPRHLSAGAALPGRRPGQDGRGTLRARQEVRRHLRRRRRSPRRGLHAVRQG